MTPDEIARRALERATPPTEEEKRAFFERFPEYDTKGMYVLIYPDEGAQTAEDRRMLERIYPDRTFIVFQYP